MLAPAPRFDLFAPNSAAVMALLAARVSGLVLVAPVFSAKTVPVMVRTSIVVVLAVLLQPAALGAAAGAPRITPEAVLGEALVGFAIGLGAALVVGAAEAAGELMAIQIGLSGAALFDPLNNTQVPVLGQFSQMFAVTLLLASNAHLVMLDALAASAQHVPVGGALELRAGAGALVKLGGSLFALGFRFAAPVVAAAMIANVALAVLSRAAPQLHLLSVAFPIQIGVGLVALAGSLALIATFFHGWEAGYDGALTAAFGALAGAGGR